MPPVSRPTVSASHQAATKLLKRIGDGFGMADGSKFAGFASEVMAACERFTVDEIDRATFAILRQKSRPHIGDVFSALDAAREVSTPQGATAQRSDWGDIALIIAWLCGNVIRWHDWQAEFGKSEDNASPFVAGARAQEFASRNYRRIERDLEHLIWMADNAQPDDIKRLKPFEKDMVRRLRFAMTRHDRAQFFERLESLRA